MKFRKFYSCIASYVQATITEFCVPINFIMMDIGFQKKRLSGLTILCFFPEIIKVDVLLNRMRQADLPETLPSSSDNAPGL